MNSQLRPPDPVTWQTHVNKADPQLDFCFSKSRLKLAIAVPTIKSTENNVLGERDIILARDKERPRDGAQTAGPHSLLGIYKVAIGLSLLGKRPRWNDGGHGGCAWTHPRDGNLL